MPQGDQARLVLLTILSLLIALAVLAANAVADDGETRTVNGYRTYEETEAELRQIAANHPGIVVFYDLGELYPHNDGTPKTSWDGNHFWAVKVSDNPHLNESDEPKLLYVGLHHGREWISVEVVMYALNKTVTDYSTNSTITELVNTRELWFVPIMNPDSLIHSQTVEDWRKTRRDNGDGSYGVDPNRNYGKNWGIDNTGSSPDPSSSTYRGPYPFSEPCTQVMRDFGLDIGFAGAISFHSHSEVIGFPWSYDRIHAPHYYIFKEVARQMAAHNGYGYGDVRDGILYRVNGDFTEWFYANTSCLAFTYELGLVFQPPQHLILPICEDNFEPCIILAEYADDYYRIFDSGIDGTVVDPRDNPIEGASVHVKLLGDDTLDFVTGPDGTFSFRAPKDRYFEVSVDKEGFSSVLENVQILWADRFTEAKFTIKDNVPPVIYRVEASHEGVVETHFGIGHTVRIDLHEAQNETGLQGVVTIQSVRGQYFHRRKPLTWDEGNRSYYYLWNTSGLKPRDDYLVSTELWDIDENKDSDGMVKGEPDIVITLRDITPPMTPMNLGIEVLPSGGMLQVTWYPNDDDTELYTLEYRKGPEGGWTFIINLSVDKMSFLDQGLENGVEYSYRLMAWDAVPLPSEWSEVVTGVPMDTVPPEQVTGLDITAPMEGYVLVLDWSESTDDTAWYAIYRDDGGGAEEIMRLPRGTTTHTDTGYPDGALVDGKVYWYHITALDLAGNIGEPSEPLPGVPKDELAPGPPVVEPLPSLTNVPEQTVRGTAEPNASVVVVVGSQAVETFAVGADGRFEGTITLSSGSNLMQFKTVDPALNPSRMTQTRLVEVDTNAPRIESTIPADQQKNVDVSLEVLIYVSESLDSPTVFVRMLYSASDEEVPSVFDYDGITKTITVLPRNELEKGLEYKVVVSGSDPAGNELVDGTFSFFTVPEEVRESPVSASVLLGIIAVIVVVVALGIALQRRRQGALHEERPPSEAPWSEGGETAMDEARRPPGQEDYDPYAPSEGDTSGGPGWEEY